MGMFKDLRDLNKVGKEEVKKQGAMLGQLQPGATVSCKVDPNDHSKLMLGL